MAKVWHALNFVNQLQEQTNWCWAAVAASVSAFFHPNTALTQCEIADAQLSRSDCCGTAAGGPCNVYGYLASSLNRVHSLKSWWPLRSATEAELIDQIKAKRPLCMRVAWRSGGAHFLTVTGYLPPEGNGAAIDQVLVADPRWGMSALPYDVLRYSYRSDGEWTDTYLTSKRHADPAAT